MLKGIMYNENQQTAHPYKHAWSDSSVALIFLTDCISGTDFKVGKMNQTHYADITDWCVKVLVSGYGRGRGCT